MNKEVMRKIEALEAQQGPERVILQLADGSIFTHDDAMQFYIESAKALSDWYVRDGHPEPTEGEDLAAIEGKPYLLIVIETAQPLNECGRRVLELATCCVPWALCRRADFQEVGRDEFNKKYGWPNLEPGSSKSETIQ